MVVKLLTTSVREVFIGLTQQLTKQMSMLRDLGLKGWEVCAFNYHGNELLLKREIEDEQ